MKNLIAISYKEDHTDTCMGCTMDRFGSAFEINSGSEDEVLARLVELDMSLDARDSSYDHYFIIEGCVVGYGEFHSIAQNKSAERVEKQHQELQRKLKNLLDAEKTKRREEAEKERIAIKRREDVRKRTADLATLKELRERYPDV
jgi:hypothetical protein